MPADPHLRGDARCRWRARGGGCNDRRGAGAAAPPSHARRSRAVPKGAGGGRAERAIAAHLGPAGTRSAPACRALPPPPPQAPPPPGERSGSAAAHADPCPPPPPPPQAALAAAPGPAEAGMLEKLEFQEEGECTTRALRCRRRAPGLQPLPGKHRTPGMQPGFPGTQPRSGGSTQPRRSSWVPEDTGQLRGCRLVLGMEPGSRGHSFTPGMQCGSRECGIKGYSPASADAAGFRGTQPRCREQPPARSERRPFCPRHPKLKREPGVMQP